MKRSTKLKLNKETIAKLEASELSDVKGGLFCSASYCTVLCHNGTKNTYWCVTVACNTGTQLCETKDYCVTRNCNSRNWTCTNTKLLE